MNVKQFLQQWLLGKIKEPNCDICNNEFSWKEHLLKHRISCSAKKLVNPLPKIIAISGLTFFVISKKIFEDSNITNFLDQRNLEAIQLMWMF